MMTVNVTGTANVLAAAKACGVERIVYTSSSAAIGIPEDGTLADETFCYNGDHFRFSYMHSKQRAEEVVLQHARAGLDVVIVNPTAVMAPGGDPRLNWSGTIAAVRKKRLPFYPSGGVAMVSAADMVDGHVKAMAVGRRGQRYILNTANVTYKELSDLIAEAVGVQYPRFRIPDTILFTVGSVNSFRNWLVKDPTAGSPLSLENVPLLTRRVYYNQSKAIRELGLSQTPLKTAIEKVANCVGLAEEPKMFSRASLTR
jgi:nucleoside-diphosphate-sugar epimerase